MSLAGRTGIFDPDKNNLGANRPRLVAKLVWFRTPHGDSRRLRRFLRSNPGRSRQPSRNVFPNYLTVNTGGFKTDSSYLLQSGARRRLYRRRLRQRFRQPHPTGNAEHLESESAIGNGAGRFCQRHKFPECCFSYPPDRNVKTPSAEQFSVTFEQQLSDGFVSLAAYVGTRGHNLLRAATPNLGHKQCIGCVRRRRRCLRTLQPVLSGLALARVQLPQIISIAHFPTSAHLLLQD